MKTLYININGENIQSSENIVVVGTPDDNIVDKFYYELGKEIVKGVDAPGIRGLAKHIVKSFKDKDEMSFGKIIEQWLSVKDKSLGENPTGTETIELPMEYVKWLQNYGDTIYTEIAKSLYTRNRLVEISLDKIYRNSVNIIINSIEPDNYGQLVVNDESVTEQSAIVRSIEGKYPGMAFVSLKEWQKGPIDKEMLETKHLKNDDDDIQLWVKKSVHTNRWSAYNVDGEIVIDGERLDITYMSEFSEGYAVVSFAGNRNLGYINTKGKKVIPCVYSYALPFAGGYAAVERDGKKGIIDKEGNETLPCDYEELYPLKGGSIFLASLSGRVYGIIDKRGNVIKPFVYRIDIPPEADDEVIIASIKYNKYGVLDTEGNELVGFEYDRIYPFTNGHAIAVRSGLYGIIGLHGECLMDHVYDNIEDRGELYVIRKYGLYGIAELTGKVILPCKYSEIGDFVDGIAKVREPNSKRRGFVNCKGEEIIPCIYKTVSDFHNGVALVKRKGEYAHYIDKNGTTVDDEDVIRQFNLVNW